MRRPRKKTSRREVTRKSMMSRRRGMMATRRTVTRKTLTSKITSKKKMMARD